MAAAALRPVRMAPKGSATPENGLYASYAQAITVRPGKIRRLMNRSLGGATKVFVVCLIAIGTSALSGCTSINVRYITEPHADKAGLIKFRLPGASVTLAKKDTDKDNKAGVILNQTTVIAFQRPAFTLQYVGGASSAVLSITDTMLIASTGQGSDDLRLTLRDYVTLKDLIGAISTGGKYRATALTNGSESPQLLEPTTARDVKTAAFTVTLAESRDDADYFANVGGVVTPAAASEEFAIVVHDPFWQRTNLSVSYLDGSKDLVKELGSELTDYRKDIIQAVAAVAKVALVGGLAFVPQPPVKKVLVLPAVIDVTQMVDRGWQLLPNNTNWWYRVAMLPWSEEHKILGKPTANAGTGSAIETATFFKEFQNGLGGDSTNVFPVVACREAVLRLAFSKDEPKEEAPDVQVKFTVGDPRYVKTAAIPLKGTIKMKPVCGADVDSKPADTSVWKLLEEVGSQVKAIRDAQKGGQKK